jgi:chitin synthase
VKVPNKNDVQEDYYKGFRSAVVLAWMACNAVLVVVVLKSGGLGRLSVRKAEEQERREAWVVEVYLKVVLWSVVSSSFRGLASNMTC